MTMEAILELGHDMFGLLSQPAGDVRRTAFVILNAGFIHRSGPFRLGTRLARALADEGFPTFRFDLPGIGDSLARRGETEVQVTRHVLDCVQAQTGCTDFVIGGLCAAADLGWKIALEDPRVHGVVLLDGLARSGFWFSYARFRRLLRKPPGAWSSSLVRWLRSKHDGQAISNVDLRDWPAIGNDRAELQSMLAKGVRVFALYTGGTSYFLHPRQFRSTFGRAGASPNVTFIHWPDCDHVFYFGASRQKLLTTLTDWANRTFGMTT